MRYNWGIMGAGKMSAKFTKGLKLLDKARLYSVGSQDGERARKFASENGYEKSYGSYEEFVTDPELDIVYIATPHSSHYENVLLCLKYGKAIICEKAFSLNAREVKEMISLAEEKKIFLMEALWPPFQPFYRKASEIVSSGMLGRIIHMDAWFSFQPPYDPADRKFNLSLGGGSLLDIGIYPVIDTLTFMGIPDEVYAKAAFSPTGSEKTLGALFKYSDGRLASIYSSFETSSGIGCRLHCEYGNMTVMRGRDMNQSTILELNGQEPQVFTYSPEAMGYDREAREVMRCLDEGLTESPVVPHSFSAGLMETLDRIRSEAGIVFPGRD